MMRNGRRRLVIRLIKRFGLAAALASIGIGLCLETPEVRSGVEELWRRVMPQAWALSPAQYQGLESARVGVCFTPGQNCERLIVGEIERAQSEILVMAYSFTSKPIMRALIAAHRRGVDVVVLSDQAKASEEYTVVDDLARSGVPVLLDGSVEKAHTKAMIIDRETILTGSYNWSASAQRRNSENLVVITESPNLVRAYSLNWKQRAAAAVRFGR